MIGPPGYGDARFISFNAPLNYKIRFENDPNATAPAQHVIILHTLDGDLDVRTFRIIAFGFGNYTRKLSNARAFIQVFMLKGITNQNHIEFAEPKYIIWTIYIRNLRITPVGFYL